MIYLSKGILPWKPAVDSVSVSHCGALHKLTGIQADLWLAGQYRPGLTKNDEQDAAVKALANIGIVERGDESDVAALFRLLINCVICPTRVKPGAAFLNSHEHRLWRWIRFAGLRLTIAELTLLAERSAKPVSELLGTENRQELTELIYTGEIIGDGILETLMEHSPARDATVQAVLGLLRKKKIYLI